MRNLGVNASKGYANGIKGTSAYSAGQTLGNTAKNGAGSVSAKSTGTNFAQGFANGMKGVNIWNAAYNMGMSALNAIKSALGIASPSKEAEKVGAWFGEGAVLGMQSTEQAIAAESQKLSDAMSLTPSYGDAYENGAAYGQGYATGKTFNFNINVNVNGTADATSAASIGRNIGQELYLEFARRERAYA